MAEPSEQTESTVITRVREMMEDAGVQAALDEALVRAGLDDVPTEAALLTWFVEEHLADAVIGQLHPSTAAGLIGRLQDEIGALTAGSGARAAIRTTDDDAGLTAPPPPSEAADQAYEDLTSGVVHTRPTPVWGILRVSGDADAGEALWILVSNDAALVATVQRTAPQGAQVIAASSIAVLKGALGRATNPASAVVVDAADPSISVERTTEALAEHADPIRVLLWRMPEAERRALIGASPRVRTWLPLDPEVTPSEIVQLLGA